MIRPYKTSDLETVMRIGNSAWRKIYEVQRQEVGAEIFRVINPNPDTVKGLQVKDQAEKNPQCMLICEEQGVIVGFLTYQIKGDIGEILNNAVDPHCGLKGIGQQMYAAALDVFKKSGVKVAKVTTGLDDGHAPARRAYERAGFNVCRKNVTYYKVL